MQEPGSEVPTPAFLDYRPKTLRFGTSGLRGLVTEMTDIEVHINTRGFLTYLRNRGELANGESVAVARDLRAIDPGSGLSSSPRIAAAVRQAIIDSGQQVVDCGQIPTPALAHYARHVDDRAGKAAMPCIMVTGSHIPADRNGVKFYSKAGEVLKSDEAGILAAVKQARAAEYARTAESSPFNSRGMLKRSTAPVVVQQQAYQLYLRRYLDLFAGQRRLDGKRLVLYQHCAVGRDLLLELFRSIGAEVIVEQRSETFVPVDTEDVSESDRQRFAEMVSRHHADAMITTDGDSDRPLLVDERGQFHRGDVLGIITAEYIGAQFAAVPISTTDALDRHLSQKAASGAKTMALEKTRIGSPFVIAAMARAVERGARGVVSWEANGGFLTATDFEINGHRLVALPTRDAVLPLLAALLASTEQKVPVSKLFARLPQRYTGAGLIDDFPREASQSIIAALRPTDAGIIAVTFDGDANVVIHHEGSAQSTMALASELGGAVQGCRAALQRYFDGSHGFGPITQLNFIDGIRAWFASGEIVHLRPSGNAPQLRIYAVSDTARRTDEIIALALEEPAGLLRRMESDLA